MPRVTVVIPTYNRSALLDEAIKSVQAQTYRDYEIVVVDDGSTDDTARVVAGHEDVHYLLVPNGGVGKARNAGSRVGTGELLAYLDDDDTWRPEKLALQVPLFDDPEVGLVHSGGRAYDPSNGWESAAGSGFYGASVDYHDLMAYKVLTIQSVVVRRSVFEDVGGFWDQRTSEDWEFLLRVADRHRMLGLAGDLCDVRVGNSGLSSNAALMWRDQLRTLSEGVRRHKTCAECARIAPETKKLLRGFVFDSEKQRALRLRDQGRPLAAVVSRLNGYRYDPGALLRLPLKLLRRALHVPRC